MYCIKVRKLAMRMLLICGILKTSKFTNIHRCTLWRWRKYGVDPKRRAFTSLLFSQVKDILSEFLTATICTDAARIKIFLKEVHGFDICTKTIYKFIKRLKFSRKRIRSRGTCKGDLASLIANFKSKYHSYVAQNNVLVSIDECAFSEKIIPIYGYSLKGTAAIVKISGGWTHYSLLLAIFSDGNKAYYIKKGAIKRDDFTIFVDSMSLTNNHVLILDNASIHKKLTLKNNVKICYTPPYSPDYNPIELAFSQIKRTFRKSNNGKTTIKSMIDSAVEKFTMDQSVSCFRHVNTTFICV